MQTIMDMSKESFSIGFKGENNIDLKGFFAFIRWNSRIN